MNSSLYEAGNIRIYTTLFTIGIGLATGIGIGALLSKYRQDNRKDRAVKSSTRLYVPPESLATHYTVEMPRQEGEKELVKLSRNAKCEYTWVFYQKPDRWVFYPQEHNELTKGDYQRLSTRIFPLIKKNLHIEGNPFVYHLHPIASVKFLFEGFHKLGMIAKSEAMNLAYVITMFPSGGDLESSDEGWRLSGHKQERKFGIASSLGITKSEIFVSDEEFFKNYETLRNTGVLKKFAPSIRTSKCIDNLIPEIVAEHNNQFKGLLNLEFISYKQIN